MLKRILTIALTALLAGPVFGFQQRKEVCSSSTFKAFNGTVKKGEKLYTRADETEKDKSIDFTLAGEVRNALKLSDAAVGSEIYLAFEMSSENASTFDGDEITSVNITTGVYVSGTTESNLVNDITIFIIEEDQENAPVYTQTAKLGSEPLTENKITLDTPYKITAEKNFFLGYYFTIPNANQYYLATDYLVPQTIDGCWVGKKSGDKITWNNFADQIGTLCIGCTIEGENFPENTVSLLQLAGTPFAKPGEAFPYQFLIKNNGYSASDLEMTYTIGSGEEQTATIKLAKNLAYNEYDVVELSLICNEEKAGIPLNFTLSKVDGEPNNAKNIKLSTLIDCYNPSIGFKRMHVIEEGTGTWCIWCPRGIVMMEYVAEKYPDLFARIAIHASSGSSRDPMQVNSGLAIINAYVPSFPYAMIDRMDVLENMTEDEIDTFVSQYKDIPSIVEVSDLTGTMPEIGTLMVESKVKFGMDMENNNRYRMAYYLTEDGLGPYSQKNGYAGGGYGPMGGWEKKGSSVQTIYNDVCRYLLGDVEGIINSIPNTIDANVEYAYSTQIPTSTLKTGEFYLTAFIVDNLTGNIVNAKQIKLDNPYTGVEQISTADAEIISKKYYSISGVEVKQPSSGVFIVSTVYSDGSVVTTKEVFK